ncbi:MAG: Nif11 family protein [Scytonematopsis contorta HA4267-MV1]|jgi:predicted ribosomally synthesized peptide with nif11-like leader|nr:Nif11 family protein [Scytonematopsis contorta HA4267-MV1]
MTLEAVHHFLETANDNSKILHELVSAMSSESFSHLVAEIGAKYGYQFTADELMQQISNYQTVVHDNNTNELSEKDLEKVTGGIAANTIASLSNILPIISKLPSINTYTSHSLVF